MKYSILLLLFSITSYGQTVQSSCVGTDSIKEKYRSDADKLNVRYIYKSGSNWKDSITLNKQFSSIRLNALIAVYNATSLPARDTVVKMFNMHIFNPIINHVLVSADSTVSWMKNLDNNVFPLGNPMLDYYINKYSLKRPNNYFVSPFKLHTGILVSDTNFNAKVLADTLQKVNGMDIAEADMYAGEYDDIMDSITPNYVWLVYKHGWGDCTAGCHYRRYWAFKVYPDCSVEYGGSYGATLVGIKENVLNAENINVYPNPVKEKINVEFNSFESSGIKIELINSLGQVLITVNNAIQKQEINLSGLPPGLYSMKIKSELSVKTIKLLKE